MTGHWGGPRHHGATTRLLEKAWVPLGAMFVLCILAMYVSLPGLPALSPAEFWSGDRSAVLSLDGRAGEVGTERAGDESFGFTGTGSHGANEAELAGASGHHSMLDKLRSGRKLHIRNASVVDMGARSQLAEESSQSRPPQKATNQGTGIRKEVPNLESLSLTFSTNLLSALSPDYLAKMHSSYSAANGSRLLIMNAQHGLGNRLRALGSGQAVAAASGRHFRLVWIPDVHCGARFQDLFDCPDLDVWDELDEREVNESNFDKYNYMENEEGSRKDQGVVTKSANHIYVKSAYRLRSDRRVVTEDLRNALETLRPNKAVMRHITQVQQSLDKMSLGSLRKASFGRNKLQIAEQTRSPYIGVHIRSNQPDQEPALNLPENAYTPEAWATIKRMRSLTRLDLFAGEIERLLRADPTLRVFLAADNSDAYTTIQKAIGRDKVTWLEKHGCLDRRPQCQQLALADMYILSHSSQILGSLWSSFTEVAGLLNNVPVRIAGRDFFLPSPSRDAPVLCNPSSMDHPGRFHGTSLFTAVMGRQDALAKVLPSWLRVRGIDEIVVVDWGSDIPLRPFIESYQDGRIKVVEVPDETLWVLSRAMNLAARHTAGNRMLKVDSDTFLEEDFLEAHPLNETGKAFWAGNWKTARNQNEKHLNGVVYLPRAEWILVNGYDECVVSYGWEDEDLYRRLGMHGNVRQDFDFTKLRHLEHGDAQRIAKQQLGDRGSAPPWQAHMNIIMIKILSGMLTPWDQGAEGARYNCSQEETWVCECAVYSVPPHLEDLVPPHRLQLAQLAALGGELRSVTGAAFDAPTLANVKSEEWFTEQLQLHYPADTGSPVIVAQLLGCCAARLEGLMIARRLALRWTRPLRIVWQPSERDGCAATFWDLFTLRSRQHTRTDVREESAERAEGKLGTTSERVEIESGGRESVVRSAEGADRTGVSGASGSVRVPQISGPRSDSETDNSELDTSAEFNLGGVTAEVTEAFYLWEVTNGLYDVIDTVTSPGVGLPEREPGQKHVFLRLRVAEGASGPAVVQELKVDGAKAEMGDGNGHSEGAEGVSEAGMGADRLSKRLAELGLEVKEGVPRPFLTMGDSSLGPGKERKPEMGNPGRDSPDESVTSAACRDPGALLVRLGGSPLQRLLGLSSAHTFAAALGRRLVAWWPADVASAGLTFKDVFERSDVEVRTGSGPVFSGVSRSVTGSGGMRRRRGRVLLEERPGEPGNEDGREPGHVDAEDHQRKNKMLAELLQRVEARRELEAKKAALYGGGERGGRKRAETGNRRGVSEAGARANILNPAERLVEGLKESAANGEKVGAVREIVEKTAAQGDDSGQEENKKAVEAEGAKASLTVEQRRETVESEGLFDAGRSSSRFPPNEPQVMSSAPADEGKARMDPIGMLDLDNTGQPLPVLEPLPRGGLAWYAWDPPAWDLGAPVVPLAAAVGKHLLLNLNGTLPALGDHFASGGVPGWKHRTLQPAQGLADAVTKVRKALLIDGNKDDAGQDGSREKDPEGEVGMQTKGEQGSVVLFVNDDTMGGCVTLDAVLDQMLQLIPNQNDPQAKSRLLARLRIVTRGSSATSSGSVGTIRSTPRSELELGSSGPDAPASQKESSICVEATELARKLVKSAHKQTQPLCLAMPDCPPPLTPPADPASEQDLTQGADSLLKRSKVGHRESSSEATARQECLLEELAIIKLASEGAERIFSFEVAAAIDLAVAWGPGSKGFHRIACSKTQP